MSNEDADEERLQQLTTVVQQQLNGHSLQDCIMVLASLLVVTICCATGSKQSAGRMLMRLSGAMAKRIYENRDSYVKEHEIARDQQRPN